MTRHPDSTANAASATAEEGAVGPRLLDGEDVDALVSAELGLEAARAAAAVVARGGVTSGRVQVGDPGAWTRILVGLLPDLDLLGYKQFHKIGKRVYYHVHLFRLSDGLPLAIVDGRRITGLRTSSTAACAFRHVFGDEPVSLAVIGSGEEAGEGLRALAGALRLSAVRVFSPTAANREAFAREMSGALDVTVTAADSIDEAVAGAGAAYVATTSDRPLLDADQVAGLRLVAAVGASQPEFREVTPEVVTGAPLVVVDCPDTPEEAGELVDATAAGWDPAEAILLGDFLQRDPQPAGTAPVLFDSVGSIEQDLVLAGRLLRAAEAEERGRVIAPIASLRTMR